MQLKARIKSRARESGVSAQLMMQNYLLERLLERVSLSSWRERVIVKGGMLISSLVGVDSRTTMDLDTTVRGFDLTHESARRAFSEICAVEVDDDVVFELLRTEDIRETDDYPGIRVYLRALYPPMVVPLSVDVTTGDAITPSAMEYDYPLLFDDRAISIMAYPLETVLAEKLETVISRDVANTRPRDFYDVHALWRMRREQCDLVRLAEAIAATSARRGSVDLMSLYADVMERVAEDPQMNALWRTYASRNPYVGDITLVDACDTVKDVMSLAGYAKKRS